MKAVDQVGECYYYGTGVAVDYGKAIEWYRKAAAMNSSRAYEMLGWCYLNGEGVSVDYNQAGINLQKAVDLGNDDAQHYFGLLNRQDNGTYTKR